MALATRLARRYRARPWRMTAAADEHLPPPPLPGGAALPGDLGPRSGPRDDRLRRRGRGGCRPSGWDLPPSGWRCGPRFSRSLRGGLLRRWRAARRPRAGRKACDPDTEVTGGAGRAGPGVGGLSPRSARRATGRMVPGRVSMGGRLLVHSSARMRFL
ncbi:hypothetical protein [Kitasatospora sp. NBC_00374]|uniref:hypothetical protein n=1 Tax=Kitasatospora sp. NBC_00374 TaxID=2975964 RepID=UPI00352CAB3D